MGEKMYQEMLNWNSLQNLKSKEIIHILNQN